MMFNLKKPCKDCPFHKESFMRSTLSEGRMEEIVHGLIVEEGTFHCHKTTHGKAKTEQHCAGAILMIENHSTKATQPLRMAERLGLYKKDEMDFSVPVIRAEDYLKE